MDFIWPPRSRCEIHHYSARCAHVGCKTRSMSDQIAKVQRLTANAMCLVFGNVKKADTFAGGRDTPRCGRQVVMVFVEREIFHPVEDRVACPLNRYFLP